MPPKITGEGVFLLEKVGVGIIGVGFMGEVHARAISEITNARLVAVSDIDLARAGSVAKRYGAASWCTDYTELLADPDIRAVIIATPDHLHREPAIRCLETGKDVLVEKPIASTMEDGRAIVDASRRSNGKLMIGHICRFDPHYAYVKSCVEEGRIGAPILAYFRRHASIVEARRLAGRVSVAHYLSIHDIDQALWILQDSPVGVYAQSVDSQVKKELGVSDAICITIRFAKGAIVTIESCWSLPEDFEWGDIKLEMVGTDGVVLIDMMPMCLTAFEKNHWNFPDMVYWPTAYGRLTGALHSQDEHFVNCVLEGKRPAVTGEEALKSLQIVLAALESARTGNEIRLSH